MSTKDAVRRAGFRLLPFMALLYGWFRDLTGDYRIGMLVIAAFMVLAAAGTLVLGRSPAFAPQAVSWRGSAGS